MPPEIGLAPGKTAVVRLPSAKGASWGRS
jgi:hypothetical protein